MRNTTAVLLIIIATAPAAGQPVAVGEIGGRMTDSDSNTNPLPGVRITITSGDERWEAITDGNGRFVLGKLRLGSYRVTAELAGFVRESAAITLSPTIPRAHIEWPLEIGCIEEGVYVILSPREAAPLAGVIMHFRVASDTGPLLWSSRPTCEASPLQSYAVEVLDAVGPRSGKNEKGSRVQIVMPAQSVRLTPGGEYVAIFWPELIAPEHLVFPIVSGRISPQAEKSLRGMRVADALKTLGRWSRERRP